MTPRELLGRLRCRLGLHAFGARVATRDGVTYYRAIDARGRHAPTQDLIAFGRRGWRRTCTRCGLEERDPMRIRTYRAGRR